MYGRHLNAQSSDSYCIFKSPDLKKIRVLLLQSESDQKGSDVCGGGGHHSAGSAMCVWKSYIIVLGL